MEMFDLNSECRDRKQQTALHTAAIFDAELDFSTHGSHLGIHGSRTGTLLDSGKFDNVLDAQDRNGHTPLVLFGLYANEQKYAGIAD